MRAWRTFRALRPADRWLLLRSATLLFGTRLGLLVLPFTLVRRIHGWLARPVSSPSADDLPRRVAWALGALARRPPGPATCLAQALVAHTLLVRGGHQAAFRIGVLPGHEALQAHAWVECDGTVVVGALEGLTDYAVLSAAPRS